MDRLFGETVFEGTEVNKRLVPGPLEGDSRLVVDKLVLEVRVVAFGICLTYETILQLIHEVLNEELNIWRDDLQLFSD